MGLKILTVDDSLTIRQIVARAFKGFDCEIFEAADGMEGLSVARRERPDIILLDLTMPILDGAEMLTNLKADPQLRTTPVVMFTGESDPESILRIATLGARDYLVKPFKEELIVERVGRLVALKGKNPPPVQAKHFDTSEGCFQRCGGLLVLLLPPSFSQAFANSIVGQLRKKMDEAMGSQLNRLVIDMSKTKTATVTLVRLGIEIIHLCGELELKHSLIGTDAVRRDCKKFAGTQNWQFNESIYEVLAEINGEKTTLA